MPDSNFKKNELFSDEAWEYFSPHMPQSPMSFLDPQHTAQEFAQNPGRFHSPLSAVEKLKLKLFASSIPLDFFQVSKNFHFSSSGYSIPLPWQVLMRYLKREGVIGKVNIQTCELLNDIPKNFFFEFMSLAPGRLLGEKYSKSVRSWGNSLDMETALSKAVGELLERFFLSCGKSQAEYSVEKIQASKKNFLHPDALSHFSEEQKKKFPRFRFQNDQVFSWVEGYEIFSQEKILIPTQCVFRGYKFPNKESVLRDPNSNGCAGHFTLHEAVLAGIYENTERDGFLIYWLNSIAPPVIDLESIQNEELQNLITEFRRYRFEVQFLNTTTDTGIPSFLCVLIDRSTKGPRVAVGGGCGWEPEKILLEIGYKTIASFQSMQVRTVPPPLSQDYMPFSDRSIRRNDRVLLWQNPEMFPKIEPFLSGKKQRLEEAFPSLPTFKNTKEEYEYTINIFRSLGEGYGIYFYEAKHRILTSLGYHVVKVIIPELLHLYLNEAFPPLGASRLKSVLEKLGYTSAQEWNKWPHPFP